MDRERPVFRLALLGALAAALSLSACGRKGPLDPPPGVSLTDNSASHGAKNPAHDHLRTGPRGEPIAPPGPNKRIPLDVLLN
jgi:predicted small lipoprotein YifL